MSSSGSAEHIPLDPSWQQPARPSWRLISWHDEPRPMVTCPFGHNTVIVYNEVDESGMVQGSVKCRECVWRAVVILDKWAEAQKEEPSW